MSQQYEYKNKGGGDIQCVAEVYERLPMPRVSVPFQHPLITFQHDILGEWDSHSENLFENQSRKAYMRSTYLINHHSKRVYVTRYRSSDVRQPETLMVSYFRAVRTWPPASTRSFVWIHQSTSVPGRRRSLASGIRIAFVTYN